MNSIRILLIDDNPGIHKDFEAIFAKISDEKRGRLHELFHKITGVDSLHVADGKGNGQLPKKNFQLDSAFQSEEACLRVHQALFENRPYAIAFVDVRMPPGADGIQTIRKIWEIDPDIQIVICTAYSDRSWEEIFRLLNPKDNLLILKKPFDLSEVLQMAHTMSEKWKTSRTLREANRRLAKSNEVLEKIVEQQQIKMIESCKLANLGELASGIAHELNTPITVIKLRSQQIKRLSLTDDPDMQKISQFLDMIDATCNRMAKIVSGFLHAGRDPNRDAMEHYPVKGILDSAISLCTDRFNENSVQVELDVPADLLVYCNSVQLSQVFLNLLTNSLDSIALLDERWIKISSQVDEIGATITFTDSGPRISQELADKIMQPFFTTKSIGKGTGLGLSISFSIIEQHRGILELDTAHPNMSFRVTLPHKAKEEI